MAAQIHELDDNTFAEEILRGSGPAVVDFWAPWCGPCRQVAPMIERLAEEYEGQVKVAKVNVDDAASVPGQYGIMSIPTIMLFKDGEPMETMVGVPNEEELKEKLNELL